MKLYTCRYIYNHLHVSITMYLSRISYAAGLIPAMPSSPELQKSPESGGGENLCLNRGKGADPS